MKRRDLGIDVFLGALAGAAATFAMDQATTAMMNRQSRETSEREKAARGEESPYVKAARRLGVDEQYREQAGTAMHWLLGASAGAAYGALRNAVPRLGAGSGLAYGLAFFLAVDEGALTLLGLAPPPAKFPWQTHARGLAGHAAFGAMLDAVFGLADAVDHRD